MATPTVIGSAPNKSSWYSGSAFKEGTATANYADNFYDFGFKPEMIYVENTGAGDLEIGFEHGLDVEYSDPNKDVTLPTTTASKIGAGESRSFRRRNHQFIAIKGSGTFQLEAW